MGAGHYSSPGGGGGLGEGVGERRILVLQYDKFTPIRLCNILTTLPLPPHQIHPPTHTHTHTLISCYWQSIPYSPLFILYATPPPSTPFILLKKYYLR